MVGEEDEDTGVVALEAALISLRVSEVPVASITLIEEAFCTLIKAARKMNMEPHCKQTIDKEAKNTHLVI